MGERVSDRTIVAAPAAVVHAVITDLASYPSWASGVREVEVVSTDGEGRPEEARFVVDAKVTEVSYTLRYVYDGLDVRWSLVEGETLSQLDGAYELTERDGTTEVDYSLEVDLDLPLPGFLKKRAARQILEQGLEGLRTRAEQQA